MDYNYRVDVVLVVIVCTPKVKILLSQDNRLPVASLQDLSTSETAQSLLKDHLNIQGNWVFLTQAPLIEKASEDRMIVVPYGCMIPEEVPLNPDMQWVKLTDVFKDNKLSAIDIEAIKMVSIRL